jgi:hypothetical protein
MSREGKKTRLIRLGHIFVMDEPLKKKILPPLGGRDYGEGA